MKKAALPFVLVAALFACGLVPILSGRATDLLAYRRAADTLAARHDPWIGGEPRYLYPPLLATLFVPLRGVPTRPVAMGWCALSALAIAYAACRLPGRGAPLLALLFAPLYANQWNGQANAWLLLALVFARERLARGEGSGGGALWGLSVALKPLALPAAAGLLVTRRLRALVFGGLVIAASFLTVVPFLGWRGLWLAARHVANLLATSWPDGWPANISLSGTLDRSFGAAHHRHVVVAAVILGITALAAIVKGKRAGGVATLDVFFAATLLSAGSSWLHHATILLPLAAAALPAGAAAAALLAVAAGWRAASSIWPGHGAAAAAACGTAALVVLWVAGLSRLWRGER